MKISKKPKVVKASAVETELIPIEKAFDEDRVPEPLHDEVSEDMLPEEPIIEELPPEDSVIESPYSEACRLIEDAISKLSDIAHDDELVREAIANLSVVLFELK